MKHKDWKSWWDGMRSKAMKAGAEALVTNLTGLIATNGVAHTFPVMDGIAMSWQTAIGTTLIQFLLRTVIAAAEYVQAKPDPDLVEDEQTTK